MLGARVLRIFNVSAEAWAERYDIEMFTVPCGGCEKPRTPTIPFACGKLRGLMAEPCPCGEKHPPYCVVGSDLGEIFGELSSR